jgi:hypothetical protein
LEWLVEFEGERRQLAEIASAEFQAAVAPARSHIEASLAGHVDDPELAGLRVVFFVDPSSGLKFTLEGPTMAVNMAIDLIGTEAKISPRRPS